LFPLRPLSALLFPTPTSPSPISTLSLHDALPILGGAYHDTTSVYGPLFTLASEPVAGAAGSSADAAAWLFKSLAALAMLGTVARSEEHTSELQSRVDLVCRLLLEKKNIDCIMSAL